MNNHIKLGELITILQNLEKKVGSDAYVFGGEAQSGDRVLISSAEIVEEKNLSHFSWLTAISHEHFLKNKDKIKQDYKAVEIY
jgi:hypothetical protein